MDSFYEKLYEEHGDSPKSLGWSKEGQRKRFEVFHDLIKAPHFYSVTDVGCGLGHFCRYDAYRTLFAKYTGIDSSPTMIEEARKLCKHIPNAAFEVRDALTSDDDDVPEADFVVASGVLNAGSRKGMHLLIENCHRRARIAAAVNMLSTKSPTQRDDRNYYDPAEILEWCFRLTSRVTLRHDYLPNDFTVILYTDL